MAALMSSDGLYDTDVKKFHHNDLHAVTILGGWKCQRQSCLSAMMENR